MKITKISGWVLLLLGLAIIIGALYSSYNIFIGEAEVPEIFKTSKESALSQKGDSQGPQAQAEELIKEQLEKLIPAETITQILNLIVYSIFIGILIFAGTQISSIGIKLMKV